MSPTERFAVMPVTRMVASCFDRPPPLCGAESPSDLSGDHPGPAAISRRSCSSSFFTPASDSSSTSPLAPLGDRAADQAELLLLRHQVRVLERQVKVCPLAAGRSSRARRRGAPAAEALLADAVVKPETVIGWHRELVRKEVGELRRSSSPRSTLDQRRVAGSDLPAGQREDWLAICASRRAPQARLRGLGQQRSHKSRRLGTALGTKRLAPKRAWTSHRQTSHA